MAERETKTSRRRQSERSAGAPTRPEDDASEGRSTVGNGKAGGRILVIEDNEKMAASIERGLKDTGLAVQVTHTGAAGERAIAEGRCDLIVLDLMLPDRDGVELCRAVRARERTPILILSALSATRDKVAGLDSGADDYLTKPFEFDELVSRIRAMLRRQAPSELVPLRHGELELDLARRTAVRAGKTIVLTNKEFSLLEFLMRRAGTVLTRTQIGEAVWQVNFDPTSNVIDVYVSMLRRKIDKGFTNPLIHTIVGTGYVFGERPTP